MQISKPKAFMCDFQIIKKLNLINKRYSFTPVMQKPSFLYSFFEGYTVEFLNKQYNIKQFYCGVYKTLSILQSHHLSPQ